MNLFLGMRGDSGRPRRDQNGAAGPTRLLSDPAIRHACLVFLATRLFLTIWAVIILAIQPLPSEPDEILRPHLGEPVLDNGLAGALLGPWQRFDSLHYLRIVGNGYAAVEDSVFPPLYPLAIRVLGFAFNPFMPTGVPHLLAAILLSNIAFFATLVLLFRVTAAEQDEASAKRAVVYIAIFPTSFFLLAAYTESVFLFFALASIWSARRDQVWRAGVFGLLASLTRLTGWILTVPLAFEYLQRRQFALRLVRPNVIAVLLPLLGILGFLIYRSMIGLPPISQIYEVFWHQTTWIPGADLLEAVRQILSGGAPFTLHFDFFCALLLAAATAATFRRLTPTYGLYMTAMLFFMLLPTSQVKPLFSFSRYALAFFPMFMWFGVLGEKSWLNRAILYPSVALYLYFSGQFFMWGWVA
jgi:hypothetical protein